MKFKEYNLSKEMLDALEKKGFIEASEIQALVIPELLKERTHLIGQAQTGTGKTAAFTIPILEQIDANKNVKALILTPTRELANQVSDEIYSLKGERDIKVLAVYGGASIENQIKHLKKGVDIVVGTPGRVIDMINKKVLKLNQLDYFVLDEADEMLNMGFIEDIEYILETTNENKKMLFFSATIPNQIMKIAKRFMSDYKILKVEKKELTTNLTEQIYFEVRKEDKFEALCRVLDYKHDFYGIVFCRTKAEVDEVTNKLKSRNYDAEAIHGDITQALREKTLDLFKNKVLNILVATDVAARGIDISNLTHVINYSIPQESDSYVHRIGRTGRAGNKGIAITFVTPQESRKLAQIKKDTKSDIKKESIPNIEDILKVKEELLIASVEEIMIENDYKQYLDLAKKLLKGKNIEVAVASLLRHIYDDEFIESSYGKIKNVKVELSNNTRLFIALGEKDGLNVNKLLKLIHEKTNIPGRKIKDIKVMPNFSFITVTLEEAELIMEKFNKLKSRNNKPIVEVANKEKDTKSKRKSNSNSKKTNKSRKK